MKRTLKNLKAEALEHGITVRNDGIYTRFITTSGDIIAWMAKQGSEWVGFTANQDVTGRKHGKKAEVMDWCLDWAINGF